MLSSHFLVLIVNVVAIPEPSPEDLHIHIHGLEKPATNRMIQDMHRANMRPESEYESEELIIKAISMAENDGDWGMFSANNLRHKTNCAWLPWINRDSPSSAHGDVEYYQTSKRNKFTCEVEKYEVKLALGERVYTDVSSVPNNKLVFLQTKWRKDLKHMSPVITCMHKKQKKCKVDKQGFMAGRSRSCCLDYKIRMCCKQTYTPLQPGCFSSGVLKLLGLNRLNNAANKFYKELENEIIPTLSAIIKHKLKFYSSSLYTINILDVKSLKTLDDDYDIDWSDIEERYTRDLEKIKKILESGYSMKICPPMTVTTTPYTPHHTTDTLWGNCWESGNFHWAQWGGWNCIDGKTRIRTRKCKNTCPSHSHKEAPPDKCRPFYNNIKNKYYTDTDWTMDPLCEKWFG